MNYYEIISLLHKGGTATIHTIPNEEWTLSYIPQRTAIRNAIADAYKLSGVIAGHKRPVVLTNGDLSEMLFHLLRCGHKLQYQVHEHKENVKSLARIPGPRNIIDVDAINRMLAEGDFVSYIIPEQQWWLTATQFGKLPINSMGIYLYRFIERTNPNPETHYSGKTIGNTLLEWLCQDATFTEQTTSRIFTFPVYNAFTQEAQS